MTDLKLGKRPASHDTRDLLFLNYRAAVEAIPIARIGYHHDIPEPIGMLGNDQYGDCITPETRVLTASMEWVPAGDLKIGDGLLAFDEHLPTPVAGHSRGRCYRPAVVETVDRVMRPCYELEFDDGTVVRCSEGHRWLSGSISNAARWTETKRLTASGRNAAVICKPFPVWQAESSYLAGYLAGAFDGEGSLEQMPQSSGRNAYVNRVSFAQVGNVVLEKVERSLTELKFDFRHDSQPRGGNLGQDGAMRQTIHRLSIGRRSEFLRFLGTVRPQRLLAKLQLDRLGRMDRTHVARLIRKSVIGHREVVMLNTSTRTYFAEGLASHNCVFAGAAHETMLWNAAQARAVPFTDAAVLADYGAVTGFTPADPASDQGTDVHEALAYRRNTGIADAAGLRHKLGAYVALEPGNWRELLEALEVFEAVGIGFEFPSYAMDQFHAGLRWSYRRGGTIEGGHYVPVIGRSHVSTVTTITWGQKQDMTRAFFHAYCDEAFGLLSAEMLGADGLSAEGFDYAALQADVAALG